LVGSISKNNIVSYRTGARAGATAQRCVAGRIGRLKNQKGGGVMEGWPNQGPESRERKEAKETVNLLGVNKTHETLSQLMPHVPPGIPGERMLET